MGAYFVGVLFGMAYWEYKNGAGLGFKIFESAKNNSFIRHICFIVGLVVMSVIVFSTREEYKTITT